MFRGTTPIDGQTSALSCPLTVAPSSLSDGYRKARKNHFFPDPTFRSPLPDEWKIPLQMPCTDRHLSLASGSTDSVLCV